MEALDWPDDRLQLLHQGDTHGKAIRTQRHALRCAAHFGARAEGILRLCSQGQHISS
jgi:hypothetical protein